MDLRPAPGARPDFVVDVERIGDAGAAIPAEPTAGELVTRAVHDDVVVQERPGGFIATTDFRAGTVRYRGAVDVDGDKQCPIFESFLRVVAGGALLRRGGALLHASSVAVDGRGYVFCGVSGAGKTTLVDGTPDGAYLSDDQSIVTRDSDRASFSAWGTPFSGSARRRAPPVRAPVAAIVLLDSARPPRTQLTRLAPGRARELLRHVCAHERTAAEAARALAFVADVGAHVPLFSLARHLDTPLGSILDEIRARLSAAQKAAA